MKLGDNALNSYKKQKLYADDSDDHYEGAIRIHQY